MGQGDNQLILIKWDSRFRDVNGRNQKRDEFLLTLEQEFERVGLKLKLEETLYSKSYFEYGKSRYIYGCQISVATKRPSRLIEDINDGLATLETGFGTLSTCTESIAKQDWFPYAAYFLYGIMSLSYMSRKGIIRREDDHNTLLALLFWTKPLGGQSISTLANHFIRGINDRLTYID